MNFKFIEITGQIGMGEDEYELIVALRGRAVNFHHEGHKGFHKGHKALAPSKSPPVGETFDYVK